jgi:hypothetical protein
MRLPVLLIVGQLFMMMIVLINIVVAIQTTIPTSVQRGSYESHTTGGNDIIEYDVVRRFSIHIVCISNNE